MAHAAGAAGRRPRLSEASPGGQGGNQGVTVQNLGAVGEKKPPEPPCSPPAPRCGTVLASTQSQRKHTVVFKPQLGIFRSQEPAVSRRLVGLRGPGPRLGTFCAEMETQDSG